MTDLAVAATITREDLAKATLDLNDKATYEIARGFRPGGVTWRHETAQSPFVHGHVLVHSVKEMAQAQVGVWVKAASHSGLVGALDEVIEAFTEQVNYELSFTIEGQVYRWLCDRADAEVGFATERLAALHVPVQFSMVRKPIPEQGPF